MVFTTEDREKLNEIERFHKFHRRTRGKRMSDVDTTMALGYIGYMKDKLGRFEDLMNRMENRSVLDFLYPVGSVVYYVSGEKGSYFIESRMVCGYVYENRERHVTTIRTGEVGDYVPKEETRPLWRTYPNEDSALNALRILEEKEG